MCTNTGVPWQHGDRRKPRCWNSSEGWRRIWCEVFFVVVVVVVTWLLVVALGLQSVSQSEKMIWWISTTFRIVVIEEPRRVSLLYVCLRFDKVKMLDYINYEKEKRVCNFHQSKALWMQ